jgi:hypothetical protein
VGQVGAHFVSVSPMMDDPSQIGGVPVFNCFILKQLRAALLSLLNSLDPECFRSLNFAHGQEIRIIRFQTCSLFDSASAENPTNLWERHLGPPNSSDQGERLRADWTDDPHADHILRHAHLESERRRGS